VCLTEFRHYVDFISKASGSNSEKGIVRNPSAAGKITGASGRTNSARTWRQAPQGGLGASFKLATATASMRICGPNRETALTSAERSAQMVRP
jgi:hypothetical protein